MDLDLKKRSEKNEIIAPRIIQYTGFGQGSKYEISTPEQARAWVRENAKAGSDGIKFFGAAPEIMEAALDENNKLGLGSACHHAQMSVARWNVLHSARAGLTTMEHWYGLPEALLMIEQFKITPQIIIIKMSSIGLEKQENFGLKRQNHTQIIGIE